MRSRISGDLEFLLPDAAPGSPHDLGLLAGAPEPVVLPPEFNGRDYVTLLLHVGAEIEHSLMVQYLFAAYSLGGPQVPAEHRLAVRRWQEIILGIAKEEMGHLVTVENLLRFLGAPLNLDREDYPWSSPFHPFDFVLQPLTRQSLAEYICAESPPDWSGPQADEIKALANVGAEGAVNRVGALYDRITRVLGDKRLVRDGDLRPETLPYQASWDEWGRGYTSGARGREAGNLPDVQAPELLILGAYSRESAIAAIEEIGEQGEAPKPEADESSHFLRFLSIYEELSKLPPDVQARVARPLATNPTTTRPGDAGGNVISDPGALAWAHLFNVRYRMLLIDIAHAFRLSGPPSDGTPRDARGLLVNRTFAEMYNLRAIAGNLVRLPLGAGPEGLLAGPPFEMPYTLDLPASERDCWSLHRDLFEAARLAAEATAPHAGPEGTGYLRALSQADDVALAQVERILGRHVAVEV